MQHLETDYLIIGAGAMGMAFADVIFAGSPGAHITLVDRRAKPGGHWNDAYPFVALHQPAAFYGVNSAALGQGGADLASGAEILAYYDRVMHRYLASGRVEFLGMCDYQGDGRVTSTVDPQRVHEIKVRRRVVDASYMQVEVPAVCGPRYEVAADVALVPPNSLMQIKQPWQHYVVIGGGKTGMDAILFLLDKGVAEDRIRWVVPHAAWLWNRDKVQPGRVMAELQRQIDALIAAQNIDGMFLRLERQGSVMRIDTTQLPSKWRCATIDQFELAALRRVKNVVSLGRVEEITGSQIRLEQGSIATDAHTLHIDCTANGLARLPARPLFAPGQVTLQSLFMCQQVFSAAMIARLELLKLSDDARNAICRVVPHPEYKQDMASCLTASLQNLIRAHGHIPLWLLRCRLNLMHHEPLHRYVTSALAARRSLPNALTALERLQTDAA